MNPADDSGGFGWIALGAVGFAVGFVLTKMGILNDTNSTKFCTWASGVVAAIVALAADSPTAGEMASAFGRIGIFVIAWFVLSIVFTIGVSLGIEKAAK